MRNSFSNRFRPLAVILALGIASAEVSANTIWDFTASGSSSISGQFTTAGQVGSGVPGNFTIESILSLSLDGSPVEGFGTAFAWENSGNASISSELHWNGSAVKLPFFLLATTDGGDLFELDLNNDPDFPNYNARINLSDSELVNFRPGSWTFTPAVVSNPVPETVSYSGLLAIGALLWAGRDRYRRSRSV